MALTVHGIREDDACVITDRNETGGRAGNGDGQVDIAQAQHDDDPSAWGQSSPDCASLYWIRPRREAANVSAAIVGAGDIASA